MGSGDSNGCDRARPMACLAARDTRSNAERRGRSGAGGQRAGGARQSFQCADFHRGAVRLLIQIGTNLTNDLFDFQKGADTGARLGPVRVVQAGLLTPKQVAVGSVLSFGLAILLGLYLVKVGGWPILAIGAAAVVSGIAYTGGPWPLGYHGLGDVFVFIFFGVIAVVGTFYLQAGECDRRRAAGLASGGDAGDGDPGGQQPARCGHRP